ncbi:hypothetical protein BEN47_16305 [Hymenobacter lapidarius]|uniref:Thioredoxin domain-containing protein n=1 Tax=Hymenobacter lapidarius TaxID=1908237 RepID=A0A1G1T0U4_9BACT|nr:hypothetical protein [Hymenobacter lapidarius]OGX84456.1 hypothetical protein BEN47_16305 [Hymenobacter lapidarius]
MKYCLLLCLAFFCVAPGVRAQSVRFEKDSLAQIFAKARQQNKPVFVLLALPPAPANLPDALKKSRNTSGLNAPAVASALNKGFLSKELAFGSRESAAVVRQYTVSQWPTYLYFAPDGSLLFRRSGNTDAGQRYLQDLAAFQQAQADPANLSRLQEEFKKGNRSTEFLRRYIAKRRQLGQLVETTLLEAYVQELPVKTLNQGAEVLFILENGPVMGSKAQQLTRLNMKVYDSLYRTLPLAKRVAINRAIISNTMAQAIATKDRALATKAADFARASWNTNYQRGMVAYEGNMLQFYRSTKDTAAYLRSAVSFYERTYYNMPADSVKKALAAMQASRQEQAANRQRLVQAAGKPPRAPSDSSGRVTTMARAVGTGGASASFLQELNNGAWSIYQTGTRNSQYLVRAMQWSKRTVDLDPTSYHYDTLAHLLYRLRFFSEAEAMQQQAVAVARREKAATGMYEQELQKIQKRTL